jgi:hypothetical protein
VSSSAKAEDPAFAFNGLDRPLSRAMTVRDMALVVNYRGINTQ